MKHMTSSDTRFIESAAKAAIKNAHTEDDLIQMIILHKKQMHGAQWANRISARIVKLSYTKLSTYG